MSFIRRRLQVARLMQDSYTRLLKFLCPGVAPDCADPARNKLLQLTTLFGTIYNLTIEAWQHGITYEEQDAWFEARLVPWAKADLLLSILTSLTACRTEERRGGQECVRRCRLRWLPAKTKKKKDKQ